MTEISSHNPGPQEREAFVNLSGSSASGHDVNSCDDGTPDTPGRVNLDVNLAVNPVPEDPDGMAYNGDLFPEAGVSSPEAQAGVTESGGQSVTVKADPGIDTQEMARFIGMVFGKTDRPIEVCAFTENSNSPRPFFWTLGAEAVSDTGDSFTVTPQALAEAIADGDKNGILPASKSEISQQPVSAWYIRMTTLSKVGPFMAGKRGGANNTGQVVGLWLDGDFGVKGHAKTKKGQLPHPPDADAVRRIWKAAGLPAPSVEWSTGGGINGLWMFPEPVTLLDGPDGEELRTTVERASERWQQRAVRAAKKMGFKHDSVGNLDRLLRLPGSVNRKSDHHLEPKAVYAEYTGATYTLDELLAYAPEPTVREDGGTTDPVTGEELTPARPKHTTPSGTRDGDTPWDAYNAHMWDEGRFRSQLAADGWTHKGWSGRVEHLTRPDKDIRDGNSATYGHNEDPGQPKLFVFSDGAPALLGMPRDEGGLLRRYLPPYEYLAGTQYADDTTTGELLHRNRAFSLCGKALRAQGFGGSDDTPYEPADEPVDDEWQELVGMWDGQELGDNVVAVADPQPGDQEETAEPTDRLPSAFWDTTPQLRQIRQMAQARRASPDAVLHAVLARIAAMADPTVRTDGGIGPTTLCWYCGLYGPSGAGKGNAEKTGRHLTPFPTLDFAFIDISTGQGIIAAYLDLETDPEDDSGKKKVAVQRRTRGYALATEGSVLESMSKMNAGSTLNAVLCSAWMSERLGTSNATVELRRTLPEEAYTLSMSLGVQEEPASKLLEMGNIGLPQRLAWAHASLAPDTPRQKPDTTGPITLTMRNGQDIPVTNWVATLRNITIPVPDHAMEEIDTILLEKAKEKPAGQAPDDPLDTHEPLWRLKCAALMALLHGRTDVTDGEWDMATTMWQISRKVRGRVQSAAERRLKAQKASVRAEAVLTAAESQAAAYEVVHGIHPSVENVAKRAHRYLAKTGEETPARKVRDSCVATKDRTKYKASGATDSLWTAALTYGVDQGWIVFLDGNLLVPGSVSP